MSSYLTVTWCDSKPGEMRKPPPGASPAERLQLAADGFECVRHAVAKKRPSVLFVFSEAKVAPKPGARPVFNPDPAKPAKEELTAAAKCSLAIYQRVFDNVQEVPLRILLRFFQSTRLDVTKVPAGAHPDISEPNAPLVLIVDAQGRVAQILSQTRIDSRSLTLGMKEVLAKGGLRDVDALCASTLRLMDQMEAALVAKGKLEVKMGELKASLAKYDDQDRKRPGKDGQPSPPSDSTLRARLAVNQLQASLDAAEKAFSALKEQDAATLRKAGVDLSGWQQAAGPAPETAPAATRGGDAPAMRTWTSVSGKTLEGRFAQLRQDTVTLLKPDGTTAQIPIGKLCPADQADVRQLAAPRPR